MLWVLMKTISDRIATAYGLVAKYTWEIQITPDLFQICSHNTHTKKAAIENIVRVSVSDY